ncbi:MAG: hypothetical protein JEZ00_19230 [Anaerolineaceae bacterium]|nr:hypothetical protein [Anaerolineaceae bacterium]
MRKNTLTHAILISILLCSLFSPAVVLADPIPPTDGNDRITGDDSAVMNHIEGTIVNEDQTFSGGGGRDQLTGDNTWFLFNDGPDNTTDSLVLINGNDTMYGDEGDDYLWGDLQALFLNSDASIYNGDDILNGGSGNDYLIGDSQSVSSNNNVYIENGDDQLYGGDGNDTLVGDQLTQGRNVQTTIIDGDDLLEGGAGDDTLSGNGGNDRLYGGDGDDILYGYQELIGWVDPSTIIEGDNLLNGGSGNDMIYGSVGTDTVEANLRNNQDVVLTDTTLVINDPDTSLIETDTLVSIEKANLLGSEGANTFTATAFSGTTFMDGAGGIDNFSGSQQADEIHGGSGDDVINGNGGQDLLFGDSGMDTLSGGADNDTLNGGDDADMLSGNAGDDTLNGDAGNDALLGGDGHDTLSGNDGDDNLFGNSGNDTLNGDAGNDTLTDEDGNDTLLGGSGDDTFIFTSTIVDEVNTANGNQGSNIFRFNAGTLGHYALETESEEDTLDFSAYEQAITIDLSNQAEQEISPNLWLTLTGWFKTLLGTNQNDTITGNQISNELYGNAGDDQIDGQGAVNVVNGGDGTDEEINPSSANTRISIELPLPTQAPAAPVSPNGSAEGTPLFGSILPNGFLPVTGGETIKLVCPAGTDNVSVQLLSGDQVTFFNLCDLNAIVTNIPQETLPVPLPKDTQLLSGLLIKVLDDTQLLSSFELASLLMAFNMEEAPAGELTLLYWDEVSQTWINILEHNEDTRYPVNLLPDSTDLRIILSGLFNNPDTQRAESQTNFSGLFVLAVQ